MNTSIISHFHKYTLFALLLGIAGIVPAKADDSFTFKEADTGVEWKATSDSNRHAFCKMVAEGMRRQKTGLTENYLYTSQKILRHSRFRPASKTHIQDDRLVDCSGNGQNDSRSRGEFAQEANNIDRMDRIYQQ